MKFLLVNKYFYIKGGTERYMFTLADLLKEHGHDVCFFSMQDKRNFNSEYSKYFVKNSDSNGNLLQKIRLIKNMNFSKEAYKKIKKMVEIEKPTIAILNLVHKNLSLSIIKALNESKIPIIWVAHDLIILCPVYTMLDYNGNVCEKCNGKEFYNCYKNKCVRGSGILSYLSYREAEFIKKNKYYNLVDLFICPSEFYKNKLKNSNFTKSRIISLPNPLKKTPVYEFYNGDYLLYFGRLSREKGIQVLLDVIKNHPVKVKIVGTGPILESLKNANNALIKEGKIEFLGFKEGDELNEIILHSKAVVIPSVWYENGPYSGIESISLGKPLIVSNLGGLPEMVIDKKTGYIFHNVKELSQCISDLYGLSENEYSTMCRNSYNFFLEKYSAEKYYLSFLKEVEKLIV